MNKISEKIVFFGSGPVAARSLELLAADFEIEAVITKPRPAHHKGAVPVLEVAAELGLSSFTVSRRSELDELIGGRPVRARLAILIDFGIIVSQAVIDYFELGIINSHFSLLPEWRGADPITFSILSGQAQTGVSLMLLTAGMDEGPILAAGTYNLPDTITTPALTETLIELSYRLLVAIVPDYVSGSAVAISQQQSADLLGISGQPTYSRKLTKADGQLDFHKPAEVLEREIRAFIEWPKSRTTLGDIIEVIITAAQAEAGTTKSPGTLEAIERDGGKVLRIHCNPGYLYIHRLKPAGKPEMSINAFLAGYGQKLGL